MKSTKAGCFLLGLLFFAISVPGCHKKNIRYNRGTGIYPGDLREDFSPDLAPDRTTYRNLARLRPAFHSSSYDYNLTAQLVTDGIFTHEIPDHISVSTCSGVAPINEREWLLDHNSATEVNLEGSEVWIEFSINREAKPIIADRICLNGSMIYNEKKTCGWKFVCLGSDDGINWEEISEIRGAGLPGEEKRDPSAAMINQQGQKKRNISVKRSGTFPPSPYGPDSIAPRPSFQTSSGSGSEPMQRLINPVFTPVGPVAWHYFRIILTSPCAEKWTISDLDFYLGGSRLEVTPSHNFKSAWMSAGNEREWIYVDLGSASSFDRIRLHWINKALGGSVQVSDDSERWKDVAPLPGHDGRIDDLPVKDGRGRFVRILMEKPESGNKFVLSELEVFGTGGLATRPKAPSPAGHGRLFLNGGNWKVQRASEVSATGQIISSEGFDCKDWVDATVPATILVSYINAGAVADPDFGDNQLLISESFFNSDFWYRNEFHLPEHFRGKRLFLNFDGINWKADVFVNGKEAGKIDGAFIRGRFDITSLIVPDHVNALAVLIRKNENIGTVKEKTALSADKNGGSLGADNPTYHASIGWDWIPTIRGRNTGIWNDVFLSTTGDVSIIDPFILPDLPLPDTSSADLFVEVTLKNHSRERIKGILSGKYGDVSFETDVVLAGSETKLIKLNPSTHPVLRIENPRLWWPRGYGNPHLYDVELSFKTENGEFSDHTSFKSGIREMYFTENYQTLNMYINGRRFTGRGGNWGFPESNLRYRGREYDAAVAYHADMNFTMIRNWVGQTGDDEFYEACDRHGIMVWQDFWLANPADGPDPADPGMFMRNANDLVKRIRNHPSIGLYCGRNEGNPPVILDTALKSMIRRLHPGLHYISNSSSGVVSGGGPYKALPVRDYFLLFGYGKFHSERGMPNVMTWESLGLTLPENALWPQNRLWGMHDYCLESAQNASTFNQMVEKGFGPVTDGMKFTGLAQWINYDGYRGMFEGRSMFRQGLLLWMSHPAWPSMVWQTYDYYLEPTAAYFGCKKACEPIHIQWNPVFNDIEVVNYSGGNKASLTAKAIIMNMDGSVEWNKATIITSREFSTVTCFRLEFPENLSDVHFIKLTLADGDQLLSENFYWRGKDEGNFRALNNLPLVHLKMSTRTKKSGGNWNLTTTLSNPTPHPALMVRLKIVGRSSGERILPVFYSDNYIFLMPGEEKTIDMKLKDADTRGEKPVVEISGFNVK
ncbi:MAG TPA: discoidin domain-containing protein [Bacteroidales bacterium]|nr:beta-glycosidase [Bacteroidales bacterium]HNR40623.1 discoidin domain-containing protein [Bacteroidales bacterium]HPM18097.1 discoidin domain-containing protein [Bacteroidales bacterium]